MAKIDLEELERLWHQNERWEGVEGDDYDQIHALIATQALLIAELREVRDQLKDAWYEARERDD